MFIFNTTVPTGATMVRAVCPNTRRRARKRIAIAYVMAFNMQLCSGFWKHSNMSSQPSRTIAMHICICKPLQNAGDARGVLRALADSAMVFPAENCVSFTRCPHVHRRDAAIAVAICIYHILVRVLVPPQCLSGKRADHTAATMSRPHAK